MAIRCVLHSSRIRCDEFELILKNFAKDFGIFPSFDVIICDMREAWYDRWGTIYMSDIPTIDRLSCFDKYLLLKGLSFHAIMPATELNRLLIWIASRKVFSDFGQSKIHGFMVSLFSMFYMLLELLRKKKWKWMVKETLACVLNRYKPKTKLGRFVRDFIDYCICGKKVGDTETLEKLKALFFSKIPIYLKSRLFFEMIRRMCKNFDPWDYHERDLRRIIVPVACDDYRLESTRSYKKAKLTHEEMEYVAELDEDLAKNLARRLDQMQSGGRIPAYSNQREMIQKLLEEKRYLAAVRRARIRRLLSIVETILMEKSLTRSKYGYDNWYLGDDEDDLDVEISAENFGLVIPNLSTLKNIYESRSGPLFSAGIGHLELCIDTSGSMQGESIERAVELGVAMVEVAKKYERTIGLTTFSSGAWRGVEPTQNYDLVEEIILRLDAAGGTNIRFVFDTIEKHISMVSERVLLAIITDTMIYDINYPIVQQRLSDLSGRIKVIMFAITDNIWSRSRDTIESTGISIIKIPPKEPMEDMIGRIAMLVRDNIL